MGTGLVNGRNPLLYSEAIRRLTTVENIGQMSWACFENIICVADTAVGWNHCYELMDLVAKEAEGFIPSQKLFEAS